jgi:peptide/nickel transport system substrate-binding protein
MQPYSMVRGLLLAAVLTLPTATWANKANDTLVYASDSEPDNLSPYHNNVREGVILSHMVWDTLVYRDPKTNEYKPQLATDWKWESPTALVLNLRQDVHFHNGDAFGADDVVFTFNYVLNPESRIITRQSVDWMKNVEKLGPYQVRIDLKQPFPAALEYLSGPMPIFPAAYFQKVGLDGFSRAPIGTGPYRVTAVMPGKGVDMEKNTAYFKESPKGQPHIGKVQFQVIQDPETRAAQLMTGAIDWIWRVPVDQADNLGSMPGITVQSGETMRVGFLVLDVRGTATPNSPLRDVKVRQAINYAIDRETMSKNLVRGGSKPAYAACYHAQFGCDDSLVTRYPYDPAKAKALLKEAGYANGFETDFYAYRERDYAEAVIGYLRNVGITAHLHWMQSSAMSKMMREGKTPIAFQTWASLSVNDASAFTGVYFKGGSDDLAKDPQVDEWVKTADAATDPDMRKQNYAKALQRISEQAYWAPLFTYSTNYAYTSDLNFQGYPDELPRFYEASWKD